MPDTVHERLHAPLEALPGLRGDTRRLDQEFLSQLLELEAGLDRLLLAVGQLPERDRGEQHAPVVLLVVHPAHAVAHVLDRGIPVTAALPVIPEAGQELVEPGPLARLNELTQLVLHEDQLLARKGRCEVHRHGRVLPGHDDVTLVDLLLAEGAIGIPADDATGGLLPNVRDHEPTRELLTGALGRVDLHVAVIEDATLPVLLHDVLHGPLHDTVREGLLPALLVGGQPITLDFLGPDVELDVQALESLEQPLGALGAQDGLQVLLLRGEGVGDPRPVVGVVFEPGEIQAVLDDLLAPKQGDLLLGQAERLLPGGHSVDTARAVIDVEEEVLQGLDDVLVRLHD